MVAGTVRRRWIIANGPGGAGRNAWGSYCLTHIPFSPPKDSLFEAITAE